MDPNAVCKVIHLQGCSDGITSVRGSVQPALDLIGLMYHCDDWNVTKIGVGRIEQVEIRPEYILIAYTHMILYH